MKSHSIKTTALFIVSAIICILLTTGLLQADANPLGDPLVDVTPTARYHLPMVVRSYPPIVIAYFRADKTEADPGDTLLLEWASDGGTGASLFSILPSGQYGTWWPVSPNGSMTYTIPAEYRNQIQFRFYVYDDHGNEADGWLSIPIRCPDTWFFSPPPDECPSGPPINSPGAEQQFEHGVMLWVGVEDHITVLFDDENIPAWKRFVDEWDPGEPESDPTILPPPGLYQPIRGIGLIWREEPGVRDRLGWALAPEAGYPTIIQRTARFKYNLTYIKALNGGVWELGAEGSEWRLIPP